LEVNSFPLTFNFETESYLKYNKVKEIVNDLAEEYKQCALCYLQSPCEYQNENVEMPVEYWERGWIPCSERLPEIGTCVIVAIGTGYVCDEVLIYDYTHSNAKEPCFHKWDDEMWKCYTPKVIAWQPLPAPYNPKGE
jgi:hypothetical protein